MNRTVLLLFALSQIASAQIEPNTNLTPKGNSEIAEKYALFETTHDGCRALNNGPRVLLTGFGLFDGLKYNISGAVLENLAEGGVADGTLLATDKGARIYNRELTINGRTMTACLIISDVLWDFAGAIFIREMDRFQPNVMIMTGEGASGVASLEAGALNSTLWAPGFNSDGTEDEWNEPKSKWILTAHPADSELRMTWDSQRLGNAIKPLIEKMGFSVTSPNAARPENDYICNNVSYLALAAANGDFISLADGYLMLTPQITSMPKIGFFHYPSNATIDQSPQWIEVLSALVGLSL